MLAGIETFANEIQGRKVYNCNDHLIASFVVLLIRSVHSNFYGNL